MRRLLIAFVVAAGLLAGGLTYWIAWAPNTPTFEARRGVFIPEGAPFTQAVDSLTRAGLLRSETSFRVLGTLTGWDDQVKAGYYTFEAGASNLKLLARLRRGEQTPIGVTVPPGTRPEVFAAILARDLRLDSAAVRVALADSSLATELGTSPRFLFGYMLPNTYRIYWNTPAEGVVRRLKREFERSYTDRMAARTDSIGLDRREVLTLASIVQWEASGYEEQRAVAGVYLNRLEDGMLLQADPTVQYAIWKKTGRRKNRLLYEDYDTEHPYNTYLHTGLPPGPITNPSLQTIRAVLNAEDHDYRFFVATGDGGHVFSRTFEEHRDAAAEYRREMRRRRAEQEAAAETESAEEN